jgi:biotin transport system substrate-specific component
MNPDVGARRASPVRRALPAQARVGRQVIAIGLGALLVALSAQVAVPVPFSPVPMTLQPLAVLVVGGLLGATGGVGALVLYLILGALGLPVFAGGGAGPLHLVGPTGGYLLAFPVAAGVTGALVTPAPHSVPRVLLTCALGMVIIHLGGVAQLALLGGDPALAFRVGFLPFLTGDLLKVGLAAAVILTAAPKTRSLL